MEPKTEFLISTEGSWAMSAFRRLKFWEDYLNVSPSSNLGKQYLVYRSNAYYDDYKCECLCRV